MRISRLAKSAAFAVAVLTAAQITYAQTDTQTTPTAKPMGHHHNHGCMNNKADWEQKRIEMKQKFAQDLSLTPDQQTRIDALHKAFYDAHKTEFDAQKAKMQEICKMKQSGASKADIHAKMEAAPKMNRAAMKADHEKLDAQIRAILTPEQAQKFDAMKAERAQRHAGKGPGHKPAWGHNTGNGNPTPTATPAPAQP